MSGRLFRIRDWEQLAKDADFQPAKMAALCPISLRQLERFFARHFGKTPSEWTRELRCRFALQLIAKGYSNKAVVAEMKFADESHFCHAFKKVYRVSPQSFSPLYGSPKMSLPNKNVESRQ